MLNTASEAEAMLNDYSSVWSHTIESGGAIPVEEHFIINSMGNIPDDFSTNIHSLNDYFEATGDLDDIRNSKDNIKNKITELNEPPKDFEKAYDEALNMYNYFMEYVDMALSPSGSLKDFNEARSHLSNEIINKHNRIEVIVPSDD